MRKLILWVCAVFAVALLTHINWAPVSGATRKIANSIILPLRIAELYVKEPDQKLTVPLHDIQVRQIKDTWHAPREGDRLHEGQDIFARRGTPVYSATEGYVVRIGENHLGGNTISVMGAGGRVYYYAHLDSYAPNLAVGDHVTTETVLGCVGTTGNARGTPPHLHFGIYTATGAINPLPLLTM